MGPLIYYGIPMHLIRLHGDILRTYRRRGSRLHGDILRTYRRRGSNELLLDGNNYQDSNYKKMEVSHVKRVYFEFYDHTYTGDFSPKNPQYSFTSKALGR